MNEINSLMVSHSTSGWARRENFMMHKIISSSSGELTLFFQFLFV